MIRFIRPPTDEKTRWKVWRVSHYPSGGEWRVGGYRLRISARIVAWSLNRQRISPMYHYEVRKKQ